MAKKDFSMLGNEAGVYDTMKEATAQGRKPRKANYTDAEREEAMKTGKTQGKKGMKVLRMNMAFYGDLEDFIRVMSGIQGLTMTAFVNNCLNEYMEEHQETYKKAVELKKELGKK